jgi:hypothetical protein
VSPFQNIASAALFLAAKVEEQPQKLEYVARVFYSCMNRDHPSIDPCSEVSGTTQTPLNKPMMIGSI